MIWIRETFRWAWHLDTRLVEIGLGALMMSRAIVLTVSPDQMAGRSYQWFIEIMPISIWAMLFLVFGLFQFAGVLINGRWHKSPLLRMAGLLASIVTYSVMTTGFVQSEAWLAVSVYATISAGAFWCFLNVAAKN